MNTSWLRLRQFTDRWLGSSLRDVATFAKGVGISREDIVDDGEIEAIRYGELYTTYGEVIDKVYSRTNLPREQLVFSKANDVIIPSSGETHIDIATASCILRDGIALGGDLNIIRSENNGIFLTYYLNGKKRAEIASLAQGVSVVHLYASELKSLSISLPSLAEQKKIAEFLTAVDERISILTRRVELLKRYKTGVAQKLFTRRLRLPGFSDDWERKKLGEIVDMFSGGTPVSTHKNYYNGSIPFIKSGEISSDKTEQSITESALKESSAKLVKKDDILYALYGATSGQVAISKIDGAINQAVLCIRPRSNRYFVYSKLLLDKERILAKYLQGGQGNLSSEIIKELPIELPSNEEQEKIAEFLNTLDEQIKTESDIISLVTEFKKSLLQRMFI